MFPSRFSEGLRPWQPRKLYFTGGFGGPGAGAGRGGRAGQAGRGATPALPEPAAPATAAKMARPDTATLDPLLGRTYAEIGSDARSNHKCQGGRAASAAARSRPAAAGRRRRWRLPARWTPAIASARNGQETRLRSSKASIPASVRSRSMPGRIRPRRLPPGSPQSSTCQAGAESLRLRRRCRHCGSGRNRSRRRPRAPRAARLVGLSDSARYEIDFRLKIKERDYQDAVLAAHGVTFEAVSDDGLVIAGSR